MINCTIEDIKTAARLVGNSTLPSEVTELENEVRYNCWGFTAYALKLYDDLTWLSENIMDNILDKLTTIKRNDIKAGDIVVYRGCYSNSLLHTAIITDPVTETIIHKDGRCPLEVNRIYDLHYIKSGSKVIFKRSPGNN